MSGYKKNQNFFMQLDEIVIKDDLLKVEMKLESIEKLLQGNTGKNQSGQLFRSKELRKRLKGISGNTQQYYRD